MILDTSAWKINDIAWVKQREEKWPIFEEWIIAWQRQFESRKEKDLTIILKNAKNFFLNGIVDKENENSSNEIGYETALILIPEMSRKNLVDLVDFYSNYANRRDLKGWFKQYYLDSPRYDYLIKSGALPLNFMLQLLRSAYGNSLAEAAQILDFEVEKVCYRVVNDMGPIIFNYYFNNLKTLDFQTANHLIPIYIDALKLLNDEDARNCDFVFSQHVKRKRKYYDAGLVSDPDRLAIMNRMLAEIKKVWNELNPIVQEKLSPLVE